jgi:Predicted integral membrane protein (DUF2269).
MFGFRRWPSSRPPRAKRRVVAGHSAYRLNGVFWAASAGYSYIRDTWLLALAALYLFCVFICLPLMGVSLRRARLLALQAQKSGRMTEELRETLNDNAPVVFGTLMLLLLPVMAWLAIFKP